MSDFISAFKLDSSMRSRKIKTGSRELDHLLGGISKGVFYLFYGEDALVEEVFTHLLVNALVLKGCSKPQKVIYAVCGNYRVERDIINIESIQRLLESGGSAPDEVLRRVRILTASSADQQALLAETMKNIISQDDVSLVLVKGIYKLQIEDARRRGRERVIEEMQKSIGSIRRTCFTHNIPLVASAREANSERLPRAEVSSFLDHLSNVTVYLRRRVNRSDYNRAYLVKSPTRPRSSLEYCFNAYDDMNKKTPIIIGSFNETVSNIQRAYTETLTKPGLRESFDRIIETYSIELDATACSTTTSLRDSLLLTATVENRRLLEELATRIRSAESHNRGSGGKKD